MALLMSSDPPPSFPSRGPRRLILEGSFQALLQINDGHIPADRGGMGRRWGGCVVAVRRVNQDKSKPMENANSPLAREKGLGVHGRGR